MTAGDVVRFTMAYIAHLHPGRARWHAERRAKMAAWRMRLEGVDDGRDGLAAIRYIEPADGGAAWVPLEALELATDDPA